jgi:hypothetical protein
MGVVVTLLSFNTNAKMSEGDWVNKVCKGEIEYTLDNKTRVDCQMPNESQEYDFLRFSCYKFIANASIVAIAVLITSLSAQKVLRWSI